jgi:hypothetical protein
MFAGGLPPFFLKGVHMDHDSGYLVGLLLIIGVTYAYALLEEYGCFIFETLHFCLAMLISLY